MDSQGSTIFQTAFGPAGLAWGRQGVRAVAFPEAEATAVRATLSRKAPGLEETDPPRAIARIAADIAALFAGQRPDFRDVRLDERNVATFDRSVLALTRLIQVGETQTYGDIAKAMGDVSLSRRVGQTLGRNPFPIIVPCHRVVGADGAMTGFSASGGTEAKRRLLKVEGALAPDLFD